MLLLLKILRHAHFLYGRGDREYCMWLKIYASLWSLTLVEELEYKSLLLQPVGTSELGQLENCVVLRILHKVVPFLISYHILPYCMNVVVPNILVSLMTGVHPWDSQDWESPTTKPWRQTTI